MRENMLKHIRAIRQYSQSRLSKLTGIPQTTISCWERGIGEPTVTQAQILAEALDATIDDLFPLNVRSL